MSEVYISKKSFYDSPLGDDKQVPPEMRRDCYAVFACRHKFCRDVCPVYFESRDETTSSYGLHTSILGLAEGHVALSDLQDTITMCLECGACELRCPNSLYTGDFYGQSTTLVELVRKVRRDLIAQGTPPINWDEVQKYIDQDLGKEKDPGDELVKWANDLDLPRVSDTMLFVDFFNAGQTTDVPRNAVKILKKAGVKIGILDKLYPTLGELYESDKELWLSYAKKNIAALADAGAKTVVTVNPHDFIFFVREYPKYLELPFQVVYITDYLLTLLKEGKITFTNEVTINATYHDPCSLNKHVLNWEAPRKLLEALPGMNYKADDHIQQWDYCCGNGLNSFKRLKPDVSYKIGLRRFSLAEEVGAEKLIVACPHCLDQFTEVKAKSGSSMEPVHILELVAQSMGII
jgi:Fe-S oxidoreductase